MCKFSLRETQMSTAEVVQSRARVADLVRWESRGPGDTDNAMRRLSNRYGLEYGALWGVRYRSPKRIWADVFTAIERAWAAERERQLRALQHEVELTAWIAGTDHHRVVEAQAVVDAAVVGVPAGPKAGR